MIKASRVRTGFDEVLLPGELEDRRAREKRAHGVPLDASVFEDLRLLALELRIVPLELSLANSPLEVR